MYKQKETTLKEARGEEIIELGWHMTKIIIRNSNFIGIEKTPV